MSPDLEFGGGNARSRASLDACDLTIDGNTYRYLAMAVRPATLPSRLTPGEQDVARRAALGQSSRQIAVERGTSQRTVDNHLSSTFRKLGIASRRELCAAVFAGDWVA